MKPNFNNDLLQEDELYKIASKKVVKLKAFYSHAFMYIIGVIVYILKEYFGAPFNFFPIQYINGFVMGIWTTVFLISAIDVFATHKIFGDEWEERKVKSILEKKTEKQKWE
ncbi:2TM domain-containing protein [Flavobacterium sp.]|uniref:2TM domain-containing protein n=1 Tax=Flavobacterium sp. TaxID=239 RepID=UPI003263D3BA